jgi:hypothetical protein
MRLLLVLATVLPAVPYADDFTAVTPPCAQPARLEGHFDGVPGVFVGLKSTIPGPEPHAAGMALAKKYGFRIDGWGGLWTGFVVSFLAPIEIAKLRCEPDVEFVSFNQRNSISGNGGHAGT